MSPIERLVVFVKESSQRVQLPGLETLIAREIAMPSRTTGLVEAKESTPSKRSPKPRISSPLKRVDGSLAGASQTLTLRLP